MSRRIHFRATFQRLVLLLLLLPALVLGPVGGCAPPGPAPLPDSDRVRSPLEACGGRIRLPPESINGTPGPTPDFYGVFSGEHEERVPVTMPSGDIVSVKEDGSVERRGGIVHANEGEAFAFQIRSPLYEKDQPSIAVWGPIAECAADEAAEIAGEPLGGTGTWVAPASGAYLVAPFVRLVREWPDPKPQPTSRTRRSFGFRRLLADGLPATHSLTESQYWVSPESEPPLSSVVDAAFADSDQDGDLDVLAYARLVPGQEMALVVYRQEGHGALAHALTVPICAPEIETPPHDGRMVVADFTGDGWTDVLVLGGWATHHLFAADGAGGFGCRSVELGAENERNTYGAIDLDDDGDVDVIDGRTLTHGPLEASTVYLKLRMNHGDGTFQTTMVERELPFVFNHSFGTLADVTADGTPELVFAFLRLHTTAQGHWWETFHRAFSVPGFSLLDVSEEAFAHVDWRRGQRAHVDMDGDGTSDDVASSQIGLGANQAVILTYGTPGGGQEVPWVIPTGAFGGDDSPHVDVADFDGDGCLDVVMAASGLSLFRGARCQVSSPSPQSCSGRCGGGSRDGSCWCDEWCEGYGDCCPDHAVTCD